MTMACLEKIPSEEERVTGVFKAMVEEQTLPAGGRNQGVGRTKVEIGESPPAVGQAEDQVDEAHGSGTLEQQEQGAGCRQVPDMDAGSGLNPWWHGARWRPG